MRPSSYRMLWYSLDLLLLNGRLNLDYSSFQITKNHVILGLLGLYFWRLKLMRLQDPKAIGSKCLCLGRGGLHGILFV